MRHIYVYRVTCIQGFYSYLRYYSSFQLTGMSARVNDAVITIIIIIINSSSTVTTTFIGHLCILLVIAWKMSFFLIWFCSCCALHYSHVCRQTYLVDVPVFVRNVAPEKIAIESFVKIQVNKTLMKLFRLETMSVYFR